MLMFLLLFILRIIGLPHNGNACVEALALP